MIPAAIFAADLAAISKDIPATFIWRGQTFNDCSFNPGDQARDPMTGGILEDEGTPTLVINKNRFPGGVLPEGLDECAVIYGGTRFELLVVSVNEGLVALSINLGTPEK